MSEMRAAGGCAPPIELGHVIETHAEYQDRQPEWRLAESLRYHLSALESCKNGIEHHTAEIERLRARLGAS